MRLTYIRKFIKHESACGILLFFAALIALIMCNSPLSVFYQNVFKLPLQIQIGQFSYGEPLLFWINEGLMAIFFLQVGLELKREFLEGELRGLSKVALPGIAALGGMLVPALIYVGINYSNPETLKGWPVPVATDIAFALGVLSLFGKRVPITLKLFLMALAIFDDVGAIIIIAIFHTKDLSFLAMFGALLIIALLCTLNALKIRSLIPYILVGFLLWLCVLKSGIHTTVSGVLLAFTIPLRKMDSEEFSPARELESALLPWVAFLVMPLFALANAGVSFTGLEASTFTSFITLGVVAGLALGKQIGVFSFTWISIRLGWVSLPKKVSWLQLYGVALLCGIGFTMSLFLGTLAFEYDDPIYLTEVRLGVLIGSIVSGIAGALILHSASNKRGRI